MKPEELKEQEKQEINGGESVRYNPGPGIEPTAEEQMFGEGERMAFAQPGGDGAYPEASADGTGPVR